MLVSGSAAAASRASRHLISTIVVIHGKNNCPAHANAISIFVLSGAAVGSSRLASLPRLAQRGFSGVHAPETWSASLGISRYASAIYTAPPRVMFDDQTRPQELKNGAVIRPSIPRADAAAVRSPLSAESHVRDGIFPVRHVQMLSDAKS